MTSNHSKDNDDASDDIYINLTVPPGAEPGVDSLTFQYDGNEMEILIPEGSVAGDVLQIQVGFSAVGINPQTDKDNTETKKSPSLMEELNGVDDSNVNDTKAKQSNIKEGVSTINLGAGLKSNVTLQLHEKLPSRDCSFSGDSNREGDGTSNCLWPAGIVLSQALTSKMGIDFLTSKIFSHGDIKIDCCELGAGLGTCGIALAHAFSAIDDSSSTARYQIVLTDQGDETIALLRENIGGNSSYGGDEGKISVISHPLTWGNKISSDCSLPKKFHLIIGSDLLYNSLESYEPLLSTLKHHLHPEGTVILSVRWRKPELEREFFRKAEQLGILFVNWKEFEECELFKSRCPARLSWMDYGRPESQESNEYFLSTNTSVDRVSKSLATITEDDMQCMSDEEYSSFEEKQIQVYLAGFLATKGEKRDFDKISKP